MKIFGLLSFCLIFSFAVGAQDFYGTNDLQKFRDGRDKEFRNPQMSPLRPEDFQSFNGLKYFAADKNFRVSAKYLKSEAEKFFMMPTSNGISRKYKKIGVLTFKLNGKDLTLAAYQSEQQLTRQRKKDDIEELFIPFKDLTNGKETYGGGRYLYLAKPLGEDLILDFNLAFNPSCAFGRTDFSCPIPPKENFLQTEIKAGEKIYLTKSEIKH